MFYLLSVNSIISQIKKILLVFFLCAVFLLGGIQAAASAQSLRTVGVAGNWRDSQVMTSDDDTNALFIIQRQANGVEMLFKVDVGVPCPLPGGVSECAQRIRDVESNGVFMDTDLMAFMNGKLYYVQGDDLKEFTP